MQLRKVMSHCSEKCSVSEWVLVLVVVVNTCFRHGISLLKPQELDFFRLVFISGCCIDKDPFVIIIH